MARFFRFSILDAYLVAAAIFQFTLMTIWGFTFNELSWVMNLIVGIVMIFVFYFNPIVISHNFLHTPFFKHKGMNRLFSLFNSANLLLPQTLYKHHHVLHHIHSNDKPKKRSSDNGKTMDPSSTYRYGSKGKQEHYLKYSALSLFRDSVRFSFRRIQAKRDLGQFSAEVVAIVLTLTFWAIVNWQWVFICALPVFYFGWFLAHMENYFEHFHASQPESRFANSVSYYGHWYNRVMFNEGFHQEHHLLPGVHWSQRPTVRAKYWDSLNEAKAYSASYPPLLGFLESRQTRAHLKTVSST